MVAAFFLDNADGSQAVHEVLGRGIPRLDDELPGVIYEAPKVTLGTVARPSENLGHPPRTLGD